GFEVTAEAGEAGRGRPVRLGVGGGQDALDRSGGFAGQGGAVGRGGAGGVERVDVAVGGEPGAQFGGAAGEDVGDSAGEVRGGEDFRQRDRRERAVRAGHHDRGRAGREDRRQHADQAQQRGLLRGQDADDAG